MTTLKTLPATWTANNAIAHPSTKGATSFWAKYLAFADSQSSNRTLWFFVSLIVSGAVFLPTPIALIGYFNAPVAVLAVTMTCFFSTFIANMGGSGIRTTLTCFAISVLIHIAMVAAVLASYYMIN